MKFPRSIDSSEVSADDGINIRPHTVSSCCYNWNNSMINNHLVRSMTVWSLNTLPQWRQMYFLTFSPRLTEVPFPTILPSPAVSYTHLRAHETPEHLVCRLL